MKKKILIFTCLFTFILSIGLFGTKVSANTSNSCFIGTSVNNYGYVENVYFNTNLSVDEVVVLLDSINYTISNVIEPLLLSSDGTISFVVDKSNGFYMIRDEQYTNIYFHNYLEGESELGFYGWNPFISFPIAVNSEVVCFGYDTSVAIGSQNNLLSSLFSLTPFIRYYTSNNSSNDNNGGFTQDDINNAYADGYDTGFSEGYEEGISDGYEVGSKDGYQEGFTAGKELFIPVNYFTTAKVYHGLHGLDLPNYLTFEPTDLFGSGVNFKRFTDNIDHRFNNSDSESSLHKIRVEFDENYRPSTTDFVIGYDTTTTFGVDVTLVFTDGSQYQTENDSLKNVIDLSQDLQFNNKVIEYIEICGANIDTTIVSMYNLNSSFMDGYNQGYDDGHYKGYNSGNADGYKQGYNNGYNVGIEVNGGWNLKNLFWTIAALPFESFKSVWNFEFLGFNIAKFFTGFLMVFIVLYIIKRILK